MANHYHAIVWVDHHEGRIIFFSPEVSDETLIHPAHEPRHIHAKAGSPEGTHLHGDVHYYGELAAALALAGAFLVTGPSTAKTEFATYLRDHARFVHDKMTGVETLDKMTDPQLVAFGRHYFNAADRMTAQSTGRR